MAFDLMRSIKHIRGLSHAEYRVLAYLADVTNSETLKCYPRVKTIAAFTDMNERSVMRHIATLVEREIFFKVEQRRLDGSRATNCYVFNISGEMRIGREKVILLGPPKDWEEQGDSADTLYDQGDNQCIDNLTNGASTTCQPCQDLNKDSTQSGFQEPGFSPPLPNGRSTPSGDEDLFGKTTALAIAEEPLAQFVEREWHRLKEQHPGIADVRRIDDALAKAIELRGRQHAAKGESSKVIWEIVFENIRASRFLQGRVAPSGNYDKPFTLSLGWLCKAGNFREVLHGARNDDRSTSRYTPAGRRMGPAEQAGNNTLSRFLAARDRSAGGGGQGGDR